MGEAISAYWEAADKKEEGEYEAANDSLEIAIEELGAEPAQVSYDMTCYQMVAGAHGPRREPRQTTRELDYDPIEVGKSIRRAMPPRSVIVVEHIGGSNEEPHGDGEATDQLRVQASNGRHAADGAPAVADLTSLSVEIGTATGNDSSDPVAVADLGDISQGEVAKEELQLDAAVGEEGRIEAQERFALVPPRVKLGGE
ncbi:hypothetical protein [Halorhodospira halochloris]|nr:hypothetical protein [Halorhodospira halochloris]